MRLPRESILFLGLMTAVCLLTGIVFGIGTGQFVRPPRATAPASTPRPQLTDAPLATAVPLTPGPQKSLLLIGVTDANVPNSSLETCWVITFRPGVPEYYVLAFAPSASFEISGLPGLYSLSQIHGEDVRLQLDYNFVRDALQARFPALTIQARTTLDRSDLSALVGQLGGLPYNKQLLTGPMLLQTYDSWPAASDLERMQVQGDLMQRLFDLLAERQWTPHDLVTYVASIPRIQADAATVGALQAFAEDAPAIAGASLVWRVYGPEMETATAP